MSKIKSSLFDEIFKLQSSAPEVDIDPEEDPIDGFKTKLADSLDETETLGSTALRKQTAVIADDPKYKGKRTSRNELYSDEEEFQQEDSSIENGNESNSEEASDNSDYFEAGDNESLNEEDDGGDEEDDDEIEDMDDKNGTEEESGADSDEEKEEAAVAIVPQTKSDDREKGHAVSFQLGIWDDLIKGRIALQKMVAACNRLPLPETWPDFNKDSSFRTEANNVHSSVRKLMSALLELQALLLTNQDELAKNKSLPGDFDEEITSESETEDSGTTKPNDEDDDDDDNVEENMDIDVVPKEGKREKKQKRKLNVEEMEEIMSKRHKDFQSVRNNTLSKWDEKTRLASGKIKAKNFAAFEMSVLKQIEQVLANRERLVKRLHQQRSLYKILGQQEQVNEVKTKNEAEVEDWDDEQDIELKLKHKNKQELALNTEIVDDSDFYHVCLRDLIEMKQNEETDPVTASKQWLEIQRLRNKQKRKVDTKASKGRKIRYNVKEKLKNFMTPFDKSLWSDEQKDDLFKSLFGGHSSQTTTQVQQDVTFNIGL